MRIAPSIVLAALSSPAWASSGPWVPGPGETQVFIGGDAQRFGHLALAHTGTGVTDGFDLGRWLAGRRVRAAWLSVEQAAELAQLDRWWNPPWPVDWQRAWLSGDALGRGRGRLVFESRAASTSTRGSRCRPTA